MRGLISVLAVALLLGTGCSGSGDSEAAPDVDDSTVVQAAPDVDDSTIVQLQARAFQRACLDVVCAGAPIYAPDSTPEAVRQAIVAQFTDEVQYLNDSEVEQRTTPDGRFSDGATMFTVESVRNTERDDVKRIDVGISKGYRDFTGRTYLFLWNGTEWIDASPDAVNVTVTSSVS